MHSQVKGKRSRVSKRFPRHLQFRHLRACPKCGHTKLEIVHDEKYPVQKGIMRLVIYRCPNGHEIKHRQLVVRQFNVPPKEKWEGWY